MWHKAEWIGYPMRLQLALASLLVKLANHNTTWGTHILDKFIWGRSEGSLFDSYHTKVLRRVILLSLDCSAFSLIRIVYCWVLSKDISSTIFKVFGVTRPGIEPWSLGPLVNTLPSGPMKTNKQKSQGTRVVIVKALDCRSVVSEFELHSRYYVQF